MSTVDRKVELERKKARLAEIRAEKKRKEEEGRGASPASGTTSGRSATSDMNLEDLLKDIDLPSAPSVAVVQATPEKALTKDGSESSHTTGTTLYKTRGRVNLQKAETVQVNIAPKEQVLYSKTTQTMSQSVDGDTSELHAFDWDDEFGGAAPGGTGALLSPVGGEEVFDLESTLPHHLPHVELIRPTEVLPRKLDAEKQAPPPVELSEEEKLQIMSSDEFVKFFDRASRVVERALTEKVDIFVDYGKGPEDHDKIDSSGRLTLQRTFFDEKLTKDRCVTCLDYCPQHPELILAAYNSNDDAPNESDGLVLVWNSKFKKTTPEYVFQCQSRVVSASFAKFHPNLVLGGCYSGQICLWDNRNNKRTPVQKTPLSTSAHTHPVYCMKIVGTQHAHNLISISTDGRLCSWNLDMLAQPQDTLDLNLKQGKTVAATCMSFPLNDANNFIVGSEDGVVYGASRHGSKQGVTDSYEGHFAPVTGVACHAAVGAIDFSHLFVSSSFDWTVKLWSSKESKPLYSFEDYNDYLTDVGWSPIHPALFACIDLTGRLDLWNVNQDTEVPAASVFIEGKPALNKLLWTQSGQQICVGDVRGAVSLFDVGDALAAPRGDEWARLGRTLAEIATLNSEADESLLNASAASLGSIPGTPPVGPR